MNTTVLPKFRHLLFTGAFLAPIVFSCKYAVSQQTTQPAVNAKVPAAPETKSVNPLDSDPRLKMPITLRRDSITIERALTEISDLTGVQCTAEGIELRVTPVAIRFRGTPLKNAMDGIGHLGLWEWKKKKESWVLCFKYDPHALDGARPHSNAEAEIYRLGKQFLDQFAGLSAQDQKQLSFDGSPQNLRNRPGMSFSALPGSMQNTVQGMLGATLSVYTSNYSKPAPLSMASLGSSTVDLQSSSGNEGFNSYSVDISNGSTGMAASFVVFHDPLEGYQVVPMSDIGPAKEYDDNQEGTSRQKALLTDSRLGANISLTIKNATIIEALQQLGVISGIPFTAEAWPEEAGVVRKSNNLINIPLKDALEKLTSLYGLACGGRKYHYSWGETQGGILLFHIVEDAQTQ